MEFAKEAAKVKADQTVQTAAQHDMNKRAIVYAQALFDKKRLRRATIALGAMVACTREEHISFQNAASSYGRNSAMNLIPSCPTSAIMLGFVRKL